MAIQFTCPHCGAQTNVDDAYAGRTGPCRQCGQTVMVPGVPAGGAMPYAPAPRRSSNSALIVVLVVVGALALLCIPGILVALLLPAVQAAREAARRAQCTNNLKQIAVALHNYHDVYNCFPPAYLADENGRPMHSWRVLILPYMDQQALYNQYRFDEPWDGPNNSRLAAMMPPEYHCPSDDTLTNGTTGYLAVSGPGTMFNGTQAARIGQIVDGTSNTLMVVEVAGANTNWMEPRDLDVTKMSLIGTPGGQDISSYHPGAANVLFADGSVRVLNNSTSPQTVRALTTIAGGEQVGAF